MNKSSMNKLIDSSLLFLLFVVSLFCLLFKYHWDRRKLYLFSAKVGGPPTLPFIGNALIFLRRKNQILSSFLEATSSYPSPVRLWMGPKLSVIVTDADQIQTILQSHKITTKAFVYRFLEPFLGKGLFTNNGPDHKVHRKLLQPLFSQKMIEGYAHLFKKHADKLADELRKHAGGPEFDISRYLQYAAFESAMDLLCEDRNEHSVDYKEIPEFVRRFYNIVFSRMRKFWLHNDTIFKLTSLYKEQTMMKNLAGTLIEEVMATRVPKILEKMNAEQSVPVDEETRVPSMMEFITEMVFENPECLTIQQCTDHLMTFMATSQDTQSTAVAFTCMMLGAYPRCQDLVVSELREVLGKRTTMDLTDVSQFKYLEMCVKESMRLYPVGPFIFRDTTEDFQLDKLTIPEGVTVTLSLFHVHRSPKYWEKPYEFYPEHFMPEAVSKRHPYSFIPFSAGPRKCIATHYSYTYMKILIATLLLNYEIECQYKVEDIKLTTDISVRPIQGYMIKIKNRT